MIGMVGADPFGGELRRNLEAEGVEVGAVGTADSATGMALIVVQADGENTITLSPGANWLLSAEDVTAGAAVSAALDASAVLLMNLEVPLDAVLAAAVRSSSALRVLNAAPVPEAGSGNLLQLVDVLVVNETEAAALLGEPVHDPNALLSLGPRITVLTLGAAGAIAATAEQTWAQKGFAVDAVDTVGAGDAFCAALAVALGSGIPIPDALRRACAAGAIATTRAGAQSALPTGAEVDQLLSG
jgi:ribokinase